MLKKEEYEKILRKNKKLLKFICNKLFTFGDLDKSLKDLDSSTGNISCPFHPSEGLGVNKKQSAKAYYDEQNNIYTIHCFTAKRTYTCYDYISLILEEDPYDYLTKNRDNKEIIEIIEILDKGYIDLNNALIEERIDYVNNVYENSNYNTTEYIEKLYKGD